MVSRRNIRVKVMQTLYTLDTQDQPENSTVAVRMLEKHFEQTRQLFIYLIYFLCDLARYAETDSLVRSSKHLPNEQDRNVNTKLAGNELLWKMLDYPGLKETLHEVKPENLRNPELIRKLYLELISTEAYNLYIANDHRDKKEERDILLFIFTDIMLPNEAFTSYIEEIFTNWDDDAEMMSKMVPVFLTKPQAINFKDLLSPEKWEFAKNLLLTVLDKKEVTERLITPKLNNWDPDRIAKLDMILMEMGVCEFLFFETIPPKVTINEYIDLAKEYSTPQSGQFVNGILDSIHKDMVRENKMQKIQFKG